MYRTQKGCSYGERCSFLHSEKSQLPRKRSNKDGKTWKNILAMVRNVKKLGCVSQNINSLSRNFVRSRQKKNRRSSRSELRRRRTPVAERSIKIREEKGTSLALMQSEVSSFQKFDHRCQKIQKKARAMGSQGSMGLGNTRPRVFSPSLDWCLFYLAIHNQT